MFLQGRDERKKHKMSNIQTVIIDEIEFNFKAIGPVVEIAAKDLGYRHVLIVDGQAEFILGSSTDSEGVVSIRLGNGSTFQTTWTATIQVRKFQYVR